MNYITQDEFAAEHPATDLSQFSAATVSGMISKASQYVDNFCQVDGFELVTTIGEKADAIISNEGDLLVFPRRLPVLSVYSINLSRGSLSLDLTTVSGTASLIQFPTKGGYFRYPNNLLVGTGTVSINSLGDLRNWPVLSTISYLGGYQTLPGPLKAATMLVFRDMVNRRLNTGGASQITQGGITIKYSNRDDGKSDDIQDAEGLLQEYVRRVPA